MNEWMSNWEEEIMRVVKWKERREEEKGINAKGIYRELFFIVEKKTWQIVAVTPKTVNFFILQKKKL